MKPDNDKAITFPRPLERGDGIAIVSPASNINPEYVTKASAVLQQQGWDVTIMPHALGKHGSYSGTAIERMSDLETAFTNPKIRAILCSRGGYGVVHLLEGLSKLPLDKDPKWLIGFSDISALHALMSSLGIASIHAPMTKALSFGTEHEDNNTLFGILRGELPSYSFADHPYNHEGETTGRLFGGNLAVLAALASTPFDMLKGDKILFIEDVSEPIYKIERILYQLKLNGVLDSLRGLIVGQFTEYKPDADHQDMETMIHDIVAEYDYPIAFNAPIGHVDHNIPLIESANVSLKINKGGTSLSFLP